MMTYDFIHLTLSRSRLYLSNSDFFNVEFVVLCVLL